MFRFAASTLMRTAAAGQRSLSSTAAASHKVVVAGGAGGIGQPLSLLLKNSPLVTELAVYDVAHAPGVAADLSHIPTPAKVTGHVGDDQLGAALKGAKLVLVPAGMPRKPGMTRQDLFAKNASIAQALAQAVGKHCPDAVFAIITNPVNSTVPIAAEALKKMGVYNPNKILGVTTLDILRAKQFLAEVKNLNPLDVDVPVIGGHAGGSILPLFSQATPSVTLSDAEREQLTRRVQNGGTEVVEAKAGAGSATLSMAQAAFETAENILLGFNGEKTKIYGYVESNVVDGCSYFASELELGPDGIAAVKGLPALSAYEEGLLKNEVIPELAKSIEAGLKF